LKTIDIEVAVAKWIGIRRNIIVPNVSWGMFVNHKQLHECDLLVLTSSGYLWEVEIKVSKADLIRDKEKSHGHMHPAIKRLYFAIPKKLIEYTEHIQDRAGIIIVDEKMRCTLLRKPHDTSTYKITEGQKIKLMRLGLMRVWALKKKLSKELENHSGPKSAYDEISSEWQK